MEWFRWYHGTTEDGKFRLVARNASVTVGNAIAVWVALLEDASHKDHRGVATRGEDYYAAVLDIAPAEVEMILAEMEHVGMVSVGMGAITICRWKERQFETDVRDPTNAERQRRFRDKHKGNASDTESNGTVTATKRPDTDTESDTEKKKAARKRADDIPEGFNEFWEAYPRKAAKPAGLRAYRNAIKRGAKPEAIMAGLETYKRTKPEYADWAHPATWLNNDRWNDEAQTPAQKTIAAAVESGLIPTAMGNDEKMARALTSWRKTGFWPRNLYGPPPGDPGCRVPPHLLEAA